MVSDCCIDAAPYLGYPAYAGRIFNPPVNFYIIFDIILNISNKKNTFKK